MSNWREILGQNEPLDPYTQYPQYPQKPLTSIPMPETVSPEFALTVKVCQRHQKQQQDGRCPVIDLPDMQEQLNGCLLTQIRQRGEDPEDYLK